MATGSGFDGHWVGVASGLMVSGWVVGMAGGMVGGSV